MDAVSELLFEHCVLLYITCGTYKLCQMLQIGLALRTTVQAEGG